MLDEIAKYLKYWCELPTEEVLERFADLPNAQVTGRGDQASVYIPGTRKDRVLLVAHSDTVFDDRGQIEVIENKGILSSAKPNIGIGADDRAGCAILWHFRNMGHSLFIPNAEEIGCVGSRYAMNEIGEELQNHQFAIEFDRRGDKDLVFYSVGTKSFAKYLTSNLPGYKKAIGAWTDICVLCKDICGVNISVGYYSQHTPNERLVVSEWTDTTRIVRKFLETEGIKKFPLGPGPVRDIGHIEYSPSDFNKFKPGPKPKYTIPNRNLPSVNTARSNFPNQLPITTQTKQEIDLSQYEEVDMDGCDVIIESMMEEIYTCQNCHGTSMRNENDETGACVFCGVQADV